MEGDQWSAGLSQHVGMQQEIMAFMNWNQCRFQHVSNHRMEGFLDIYIYDIYIYMCVYTHKLYVLNIFEWMQPPITWDPRANSSGRGANDPVTKSDEADSGHRSCWLLWVIAKPNIGEIPWKKKTWNQWVINSYGMLSCLRWLLEDFYIFSIYWE